MNTPSRPLLPEDRLDGYRIEHVGLHRSQFGVLDRQAYRVTDHDGDVVVLGQGLVHQLAPVPLLAPKMPSCIVIPLWSKSRGVGERLARFL